MSIKIEHCNLETRKTLTNSQFRYETFYCLYFITFYFRHKEREAQSFYSGSFISCGTRYKASRASESQPSSPEAGLNSQTDFFKISQNPPRASGAWRHSHCVTPFPISGYCDISEWHVYSALARTWTPALILHLSNPCTEPKCSQPN